MEDIKIKEILDQVERYPSSRCWQAIESALPAAGAGASSMASTKGFFHLSSTALKVAIGIGAAAAVGTAITLALLKPAPQLSDTTPPMTTVATDTTDLVSTDTPILSMTTDYNHSNAHPHDITSDNLVAIHENNNADTAVAPSLLPTSTPALPASSQTSAPTPAVLSTTTQPTNTHTSSVPQSSTAPSSQRIAENDPLLVHHTIPIEESTTISLTIPNVFTPNGDGINDFFEIVGIENCEQHRLIIKNQAGRIVFQSTDYQNNWDAAALSNGTYFYQLAYKYKGIEEVRSGMITVLR